MYKYNVTIIYDMVGACDSIFKKFKLSNLWKLEHVLMAKKLKMHSHRNGIEICYAWKYSSC